VIWQLRIGLHWLSGWVIAPGLDRQMFHVFFNFYYVPRRLSGVRKQKNEKKEETRKKAQLLFVLLGIFMHLSYSSSYINSTNTAPRVDLVFAFGSVVSAIPPM